MQACRGHAARTDARCCGRHFGTLAGPAQVRARQGAAGHTTHSAPLLHAPSPDPLQDPRKYARAKELLIMDEEIRRARQVVEEAVAGKPEGKAEG